MRGTPVRSCLFASFLVAAAVALAVVPSAQAANIVPNPGFEVTCAAPCQWSGTTGSFPASDPLFPHFGLASLKITSTQAQANATAISDCVSVTAGTMYNLRIFYRTAITRVTQIGFGPVYFSNADCTGSNDATGGSAITNSPVKDGSWHSVTGVTTALTNPPFNAQSARLQAIFSCSSGCQVNDAVNWDDAVMDTQPLAVTTYGFRATRSHGRVVLRWRTGTEVDALGFNVYRQQAGQRVSVNKRMVPALGRVSGGSYSFLDRHAPKHRALRYWLHDVDVSGSGTWHGPVRVAVS